jgi:hypothetical protein
MTHTVNIGDTVEFDWRGKTRRLLIDEVHTGTVYGKDLKTGKYWQCEDEYITAVIPSGQERSDG